MISEVKSKMPKQLQTAKEIASYFQVSPKTVYQWAELGQIPHLKLNGCIRFDLDAINEWLLSCQHDPICGKIMTAQTVAVPRKGR